MIAFWALELPFSFYDENSYRQLSEFFKLNVNIKNENPAFFSSRMPLPERQMTWDFMDLPKHHEKELLEISKSQKGLGEQDFGGERTEMEGN